MTHTAVEVVLRSLAHKLGSSTRIRRRQHIAEVLSDLRLFKEESSAEGRCPTASRRSAATTSSSASSTTSRVIAALPSGVHRLLQGVGKPIDWSRKYFDLLVIDEASQLSLPAAVLAGAPLRDDGQAIVVGDHRQMAPILAHDWDHEPRRGAQDTRIYASTFESLRDRGFPIVGLDRSFRLAPRDRGVPREARLRRRRGRLPLAERRAAPDVRRARGSRRGRARIPSTRSS